MVSFSQLGKTQIQVAESDDSSDNSSDNSPPFLRFLRSLPFTKFLFSPAPKDHVNT